MRLLDVSMLGSSSASKQVLGQWQTTSEAQAARSAQTNTNSLSSQSQASSQQLASSVAQQITGAQSFPALHSIPSSQSLKVTGSPPHQPYVPPLTFQVQPGTGLTAPDNSTQKPREVETKSDGMGAQSCVEERLKGLISYLIRLSKQRVDIEKSRHRFVITSDVRRQILLVNQKAKEEWDKKQAEESEKLRKVNELQMDGNTGVDAEKDKEDGRPKALKVALIFNKIVVFYLFPFNYLSCMQANKEEDDKMRATAANVAARAAVGGDDMLSKWQLMAEQARQKREGLDGAPGKTASSKPLLSSGRSSREKQESEKKGSSAVSASGKCVTYLCNVQYKVL
ncbi:hypothetical protein B296_00048364 [Ensete ventricosum]|uniref:Transcription initiation factor TFIID component TAF4 C-terminal domain-containing protein n=1 Tax=Ensete ventricosum TaxID=4639 RepID=A0A426YL44_ENSVE|nr:hypothetical protein B296_00048364 [Ensete ventricosum]